VKVVARQDEFSDTVEKYGLGKWVELGLVLELGFSAGHS